MDLNGQFKRQTGLRSIIVDGVGNSSYTDEYVEWLEDTVRNVSSSTDGDGREFGIPPNPVITSNDPFKCDICGKARGVRSLRFQVLDENYNIQSGIIQCKSCYKRSLRP